jgi:hypothetical protein
MDSGDIKGSSLAAPPVSKTRLLSPGKKRFRSLLLEKASVEATDEFAA